MSEPARPGAWRGYCALPHVPPRVFGPGVAPGRARLLLANGSKWVNGTVLHYYFFDRDSDGGYTSVPNGTRRWMPWTASAAQMGVVRRAFRTWKEVGIGLEFREVASRDEAEIRIAFMQDRTAWSYVGREVLGIGRDQPTMNLGWDLTDDYGFDTALHEIGHSLGFPHEHQNPHAGIVWDEAAVHAEMRATQGWSRDEVEYNVLRKIPPDTVQGSNWDPDSVMHYEFGPGLIQRPEQYRGGLRPAGGLSARDRTWVKTFYPELHEADYPALRPFVSAPLALAAGEQGNFSFRPAQTRKYQIATFGDSDATLVLFERRDGELRHVAADDDSGDARNARIEHKLVKGRHFVVRVRINDLERQGETAVMVW